MKVESTSCPGYKGGCSGPEGCETYDEISHILGIGREHVLVQYSDEGEIEVVQCRQLGSSKVCNKSGQSYIPCKYFRS